ncbi:MAG: MerR family transcriptional regulator [Firmicutes bacterium]|nr:MerR family transcriptional regulator [Bacillota bacterium]
MMTVHEVSRITGVSARTLQYYDSIGLLSPSAHTEAGYRLYDENALMVLQEILLLRELRFPLKEIGEIVGDPGFDRQKAISQQIELLKLEKERLEGLIELAEKMRKGEDGHMSFSEFDRTKLDEYAREAKKQWGGTPAYAEYEKKSSGRTAEEQKAIADRMMDIFAGFASVKDGDPAGSEAQALVRKLQAFITENYYTCTDEILAGLGKAYGAGGEFTKNIDGRAGEGTAAFAAKAVEAWCTQNAGA